ncbi:DUF3159 domain-containing protein [Glaciihabitans sp. UYNi722]|uniref:DUF3159 domain-containing protein n=1 Tax=Glaciihabitans sp. UYNi722 TaxID=3156344 RepID=UPI00339B2966
MSTSGGQDEQPPSFRESFGDAMRKTGLGQVAPGEVPTGKSLLKAIGGVRGLIESIVPGLAFLVVYSLSGQNLLLSVLIPLALSVIFVVIRLVTKSGPTQALGGIAVLAASAILALITGRAETNFLPGIFFNAGSLAVLLLSIVVRWPLIGVIVGFLTNEGVAWRTSKPKRRVLYLATWLWAALFALRLVVEVPLYLAHEAEWLAGTKLLLGVPLYAGLLWVTWLLVRAVYGRSTASKAE